MLQCWQESPDERPLFSQLQENLESMMIRDTPYLPVNFRGVDESSVYYNVPSFNSVTEEEEDEVTLSFGGDKESNNAADSGTGSLTEEGHTIEVIEQPEGYSGLAFEALDQFPTDMVMKRKAVSSKAVYSRQDSIESVESVGSQRPLVRKHRHKPNKGTDYFDDLQNQMCRPLARKTSLAV